MGHYALWGVYWGVLILAQRFFGWLGVAQKISWSAKVAISFGATSAGWLLFRERNLGQIAPRHDLPQSPFAGSAEQWRMASYFVVLVFLYSVPLVIHMLSTGLGVRNTLVRMQHTLASARHTHPMFGPWFPSSSLWNADLSPKLCFVNGGDESLLSFCSALGA